MAEKIVAEIVKLAFEKAQEEVNSDKKNTLASHISRKLDNKYKISYKSIVRLFDKYIYNIIIEKRKERSSTVNAVCSYIGYEDYADFVNNADIIKEKEHSTNEKQSKITQVEVKNSDAIKIELVNNKNTTAIWTVGILIILVTAFIWKNSLSNKNKTIPNQITINNFNANKNYYYYTTPKGNIELTENPTQKDAKPLTYAVFNKYLIENNIDTSNQKLELIKVQYFDKKWKERPLQKDTIQSKKESVILKEKARKTQEKKVSLNSKTLFIEAKNKDKTDIEIQKKLIQKFKTKYRIKNTATGNFKLKAQTRYIFTNSKLTKDRIICTLSLDYTLTDKNNLVIFSESKQIKGTGFSKETAKNNTINKLKL